MSGLGRDQMLFCAVCAMLAVAAAVGLLSSIG